MAVMQLLSHSYAYELPLNAKRSQQLGHEVTSASDCSMHTITYSSEISSGMIYNCFQSMDQSAEQYWH